MLIIDDNMFRLAKMQETLLKVSSVNREENLKKYQEIVSEIDAKAFADILEEIKHIDEHNHSYEDELQFLEGIVKTYDQLFELQSGFKGVCEKYGGLDFELSDLSRLNIQYIRSRINAISAHLTNLKNIGDNEVEIEKLNAQLREQLKQKSLLDSKLLELENSLRENFANTEGRMVEDGKLVPTSVLIEYKKLGLDFTLLLSDLQLLDDTLSEALKSKNDALDTLKATEVCYNNDLTAENKQFLDNAKADYLKAEYMLTMLKIIKLLSENHAEYDKVMKKREDLLELIEYRFSCLKCLGIVKSKDKDLDPFIRTKVQEQHDVIAKLVNRTIDTDIDKTTKKISDLVSLTEKMIRQKVDNQIALTDTKSLVESKMSISDIDITGVDLVMEDVSSKEVLPNQVIEVRAISSKLNMSIVTQKTAGVIRRVNKMVNRSVVKNGSTSSLVTPDLVILPGCSEKTTDILEEGKNNTSELAIIDSFMDDSLDLKDADIEVEEGERVEPTLVSELPQVDAFNVDDELFETVTPFSEPIMFSDRSDETEKSTSSNIIDFPVIEDDPVFEDTSIVDEEENGAFWAPRGESETYSDEQIGEILSLNDVGINKVRKKAA